MQKKRTKLLFLLFTILVVVAMVGMVACSDSGKDTEEPDNPTPTPSTDRTFSQYMETINSGLKGSKAALSALSDYHVASEYSVKTREENLTLTYEAVYKKNRRDGYYYIKLFDNQNAIDRLSVYYDAADLYVTAGEEHYVVNNFGTLLLFDTFSAALDALDMARFAYGSEMQEIFSANTIAGTLIDVKNMSSIKTGQNSEKIIASEVILDAVMVIVSARLGALHKAIGTTFDAVTDNYLGFRLSRLLSVELSTCSLKEASFNINDGNVETEKIDIRGKIDKSDYFIIGEYAYDVAATEITAAKSIPTAHVYGKVSPGQGSLDGTTTIPSLRESDYRFALDYDLVPTNNAQNKATMRIYDDLSAEGTNTGKNKYNDINEILSVYYKDGLTYLNTQGVYDYIGTAIALYALRLPKVYLASFDLSSFLTMIYSDLLSAANGITTEDGKLNVKNSTLQALINATESDVDKKEIKITVTEDLVKEVRGDSKSLMSIMAEELGVEEDMLRQYLGDAFFRNMRLVLTYNFGTKITTVDVYDGVDLVMTTKFSSVDSVGVIYPNDLNELNYTEFKEPDLVTLEYEIDLSAYGANSVELSKFIGAFLGDATGKNTPYVVKEGQHVVVKGKTSESYIQDANGKRKAVTSLDLRFYLEDNNKKTTAEFMSVVSDSDDLSRVFIEMKTPIGKDGYSDGVRFVMDKQVVADNLATLTDNSIFKENTGLNAFLAVYNAASKNSKTYTTDGYFCVDLAVSDDKDPIDELVGIKNTYTIVKAKIGFDVLELSVSGEEKEKYTLPVIKAPDNVSAISIYSDGSRWKETVTVTVSDTPIDMFVTYDPETTKIVTGQSTYNPEASLFGKEISYSLEISTETGTYNVKNILIDKELNGTPLWVIDSAFYAAVPDEIRVMFEGGESGSLKCSIEGFSNANVTHDGYNIPLLAGVTKDGMGAEIKKYKLVIGRNSIASVEKEIYVAVINRTVKPVTDNNDNELYYTSGNKDIPIIAQFVSDPYTYAMTTREYLTDGKDYDYLAANIRSQDVLLKFDDVYGKETYDDGNEEKTRTLTYEVEGYTYMRLTDLKLQWEYAEEYNRYFSVGGETRYAVATYGEGEARITVAIKITVEQKEIESVIIDGKEGSYVMDVLKKETYDIPTQTTAEHTVKLKFTDGKTRIVSMSRPAAIDSTRYCEEYVYGELAWVGREDAKKGLTLNGASGLFEGTGGQRTNDTSATIGSELGMDKQAVTLTVIAPARQDATSTLQPSLVQSMSDKGEPSVSATTIVNMVKFEQPKNMKEKLTEVEYFSINPYNKEAKLPDTIWLYVPSGLDTEANAPKEWVEYPVKWLTTDANGKELNIIKEKEGSEGVFVLAHPRTEETKLLVYGVVGNSGDATRTITIATALLNMESNVKAYTLYLGDGKEHPNDEAVAIDPYLSYASVLPMSFSATLGSGEKVEDATEWYYSINGVDYPVIRTAEYAPDIYRGNDYDKYYDEDGYLLFARTGGQGQFKMTIAAGDVKNDIYVSISVAPRTIKFATESDGIKISDYIDIYADGKDDGETYTGIATVGYTDVNYYNAVGMKLYNRIVELLANGGKGIAGISFVQTDDSKLLYAKEVSWETEALEDIKKGLEKRSGTRQFSLGGTINAGKINEAEIRIKIVIDELYATLTEIRLVSGETMIDKGVYTLKNDEDGNKQITIVGGEANKVNSKEYHRETQYNNYFGFNSENTDYKTFGNMLFFDVSEIFRLSRESSGIYSSPSDYFRYVFDNITLIFQTGNSVIGAKGAISYGTKDAAYFNKNLLGFGDYTYSEDGRELCYGFLILERLSEGPAVDRTLVIVAADKASVENKQKEDQIDAFGENLEELYPERFDLPSEVAVTYKKKADGTTYEAKYKVNGWTPVGENLSNESAKVTSIDHSYINVIDGSSYQFSYILPDLDEYGTLVNDFRYIVNFRKKNVHSVNFNASGQSSVYDIKEGKITIYNTYSVLSYDATTSSEKKYALDTDAIPTVLQMISDATEFQSGGSDIYTVKWNFFNDKKESLTMFDESIFQNGTDENGVLIGTYTFDSYCRDQKAYTQTLELRIVFTPMKFYSIADDNFTVIAHQNKGENELLNTIVIDPYNSPYNGNFPLPERITLSFNGGGQTFTFTGATYALISADGVKQTNVKSVTYDENGHTLTYAYLSDPTFLELRMYVRGYTSYGIRINVKFLKRNITDTRLPNCVYTADGFFDYEKDESGNVLYNGDEPIRKTYNAYANYTFTPRNGKTETGKTAVYYVDPYNSASYELPKKASFEFAATEEGKYVEYSIAGWQYYDYTKGEYTDFAEYSGSDKPSSSERFYMVSDGNGGNKRFYFNPDKDSYKGHGYALRGYISIADERQYFDVVMIVLNRTLRASVMLKDEYKVTYDFTDPIAAMLEDIPSLFGADAFVDYDMYARKFSVDASRSSGEGTFVFELEEDAYFSRKDENGVPTNNAVFPTILWAEEYDADGDGELDTFFDELVDKGFIGTIDGNLYSYDVGIEALFEYYSFKINSEYDRLVSALLWDTLFLSDGTVSTLYTDGAIKAIESEAATYEKEVVYATYGILLKKSGTEAEITAGTALSDADKYSFTASIIASIKQDAPNATEETIVYKAYEEVKARYTEWLSSGGTKDVRTRIYEAWASVIADYRAADVKNSGNISANQVLKAQHFNNLYNKASAFTTAEKASLATKRETLTASLYVNINAALWDEVYKVANIAERAEMDKYATKYATTGDEGRSGKSMASDFFRRDVGDMTSLGIKGEEAKADVSIPVIKYSSLTVADGGTTIRFNRFNFQSIDKSFKVTFELSYDEIYKRMLEEAKEAMRAAKEEEKKSEVLSEYAEQAIRDRVNAIAPTTTDRDGNVTVIDGLKANGKAFDYDMWLNGKNTGNYASFWNALVTYYKDSAVQIISAYVKLDSYEKIMEPDETEVTGDAWNGIVAAYKEVKILAMADGIIYDIKNNKYDFETQQGRKDAVKALAEITFDGLAFVKNYDAAYEMLGYSKDAEVTDEVWKTVTSNFRTKAFYKIAVDKLAEIENKPTFDRRQAIRDLAEYLVECDVNVQKLNALYEEAEKQLRAEKLMSMLISEGRNTDVDTAITSIYGDVYIGYADLFEFSYPGVASTMYALLDNTFGNNNKAFNTLKGTYSDKVVAYMALNAADADLKAAAKTYFTFLTRYAKGKTSPYDKMIENVSGIGYTKEQIEFLLYYATPDARHLTALKGIEKLGMTEDEIAVALKKMKLYDTFYAEATVQEQKYYSAFESEADYIVGSEAMTKLFEKIETNGSDNNVIGNETVWNNLKNALVGYYDENGSVAERAFRLLVEEETERGESVEKEYKAFYDAYAKENEYLYAKDMIKAIRKNYKTSSDKKTNSLTNDGYIAENFYQKYFGSDTLDKDFGVETLEGINYYDEQYLEVALDSILTRKGISCNGTQKDNVLTGYMKDRLLRTVASYYENASDEAKTTIEEVAEAYTGEKIKNNDAEKTFIDLAKDKNLSAETGKKIYNALKERADFADKTEDLQARYYYEWLVEALGSGEVRIKAQKTADMENVSGFSAQRGTIETYMKKLLGKDSLTDEETEAAKKLTTEQLIETMLSTAKKDVIKYDDVYKEHVLNNIGESAMKYAYDKMCETTTEVGNYLYKDGLEQAMIAKTKAEIADADFAEEKFNEAEKTMLNEKMAEANNAIEKAIKTVIYTKAYDKLSILSLTADEFAYKLYAFLKGVAPSDGINAAVELFGEDRNGAGGIIGEPSDSVCGDLKDWWKKTDKTVYGVLGEEEQAFIEQIYKQVYYQGNLNNNENAAEKAYATMMTSIYLFLEDKAAAENSVPADYFSKRNEDEYKAFIVGLMVDGDLLSQKGHLLTLAANKLGTMLTSLAQSEAKYLYKIVFDVDKDMSGTFDECVAIMLNTLIKANGVVTTDGTKALDDEEIEERKEFYLRYLEKAVNYVEYTSVYDADEYDKNHSIDLLESNPLRSYADKIYSRVTGKGLDGASKTDNEGNNGFAMWSFAKYLVEANGDYAKAIELMAESREVTINDFVGEDHAEEGYRHVIYFDRTEWEKTLADGSESNPYYDNRDAFIANAGKTYRIIDDDGNFKGYANSLKGTGLRYEVTDITQIDLYFNVDENNPYNEPTKLDVQGNTVIDYTDYAKKMEDNDKKNVLWLDALSPELPDEAYAIGYIKTGDSIDYASGIKLGKVKITAYSDEFKKLRYAKAEAKADNAYYVDVKTADGTTFRKQGDIKVGYLGRNVSKIYLTTNEYHKNAVKAEQDGDYVGMYSIYDDVDGSKTYGKNIIYIDPTDEEKVLSRQKTYKLPETLAIQCEEGEKINLTDVVWDASKVQYGLRGTDDYGIEMRVLEYRYVDGNGVERKMAYNYSQNVVTMTTYGDDGSTTTEEYTLNADDMVKWNTLLVIENRTIKGIKDSDNAEIATPSYDAKTKTTFMDATKSAFELNPYYPEYPEEMTLVLANGTGTTEKKVTLAQSDWTVEEAKFGKIKRGETDDYTFFASFYYLGCEMKVKFKAMKIKVPILNDGDQKINGGTIYFIRNGGSYGTQFETNYGVMYYNFAEGEAAANWQKVPVTLKDASRIDNDTKTVQAVIGSTSLNAGIGANVEFKLKIIDLKNYAVYDGGYNDFVYYDYYGVPVDGAKKANGSGNSPAEMGSTYLYADEDGNKTAFTADAEDLKFDFTTNTVTVYATYAIDVGSGSKLACDAQGTQKRGLYFAMPMETYENKNVTSVEFNTDETDKKWTWTKTNKTSANYVDAIYWQIGTPMKASDLPTAVDKATGTEIKLDWDLSELNVNRANVATPNNPTKTDGTDIYGYYMLKNGVWQSLKLRVYIEKINITSNVIAFTKKDGTINAGTTPEKTYDAEYYVLPFNSEADNMKFLRDDGTKTYIDADNYVVEYRKKGADNWSDEILPLDVGTYYIRVRLRTDDYNVYIEYGENEELFTLTIKPYEVNMTKVKFENETDGIITVTYGQEIDFVVTDGLPAFTPAGWFADGEMDKMYNEYIADGVDQSVAKATIYRTVYNRVSDRTRAVIDGWYKEGKEALGYSQIDAEKDFNIKAWVYESKFAAGVKLVEVNVKLTYSSSGSKLDYVPTDVGTYNVEVTLDDENGNYTQGQTTKSFSLRIVKQADIKYEFANANLVYNGTIQNPEITNLHKDGAIPYGVKVTYTYTFSDGKELIVTIEGVKDSYGNVTNKVSLSGTVSDEDKIGGIRNVGEYNCFAKIEGGNNYEDGTISTQAVGISPVNIFIDIEDITSQYLSAMAALSEYVRVRDADGNAQAEGILIGNDKLADLGVLKLSAADASGNAFASYFKVGTYYTFVNGLAASSDATATYTEINKDRLFTFDGELYTKLALKSNGTEGSLYNDATGNAALIKLFGNYNIFVKTEGDVKASGIYTVEGEKGSIGVSTNEELQAHIANLEDGDDKILYLSAIIDEDGKIAAYDKIVVNKNVRLKIVGYYEGRDSSVEKEIETKMKGITVLKGIVELNIVSIESDASGSTAVYVGDGASSVTLTNCRISKSDKKIDNIVGIRTSLNSTASVIVTDTTIEGISKGIYAEGGTLTISQSTISKNTVGAEIQGTVKGVNITTTAFCENSEAAISSEKSDITIRKCAFENNYVALNLPDTSIRTDANNLNTYADNTDDKDYQ